ncbi:6,7-dimethyl-8-ribityllumazine synthase [Pseudoflavitalea sp. G-6-1-2]|uniref:6,7-dimethyl-8-ribityllumazine synthase n=1 Tax=Pseudoflavitalea sp. G-6-1-2 TaxID=2728841 RepID=UPI00146CE662|nr:6,7-dimethyl-8-ribityllumazine synthase [Pseudoflavitalea sp. G-6-1-2]NML23964.1 6,7-dimethyl-8-ribityllumazine synthase [Pseudoflavitalea sp. G-6-1-2]
MADVTNSKLFQIDTGILSKDACIVIVKTEWNAAVIDELENGAIRILKENGITDIRTITVPGAFEIPFGVKAYWEANKAKSNRPCAFITLGCVLRGDTPHFEYVCRAVTDGVLQLNLQLPVPVIFGVLTVDNQLQADERIGGRHGHKGEEAAITALKMMVFNNSIKK